MSSQTVLEVGVGKQFQTINAAILAADQMGGNADIKVDAGTYINDGGYLWDGINNVTIEGVGGMVKIVNPTYYAGGKAAIVTGGQNIVLKNLDISGVTVPDRNGAAIRYDQGTLLLNNVHLHDNENGLLGAADPNGSITIQDSEIDHNGTSAGNTHNIYIGNIANFTLTNSYVHDANVGHEVKSRAQNNIITNNRILDNNGTSSYAIDLPNGGNAIIKTNVIEQGPNNQNRTINAYGEEGNLHAGKSVIFEGNTIVNDDTEGRGSLWNNSGGAAITSSGNKIWNVNDLGSGVNSAGYTTASSRPTLDISSTYTPATPTTPTPSPVQSPDVVVVHISEDAFLGHAKFQFTANGNEIGGVQTASASHAAGQTQDYNLIGPPGLHPGVIGIKFLNDLYGGTPLTDRNLYIDGITVNGVDQSNTSRALKSNGSTTINVDAPKLTEVGFDLSGQSWRGNAVAAVSIDGKQLGNTIEITAAHVLGEHQHVSFMVPLDATAHKATVSFLNDAYGGTPQTDRNLFLDGISVGANDIVGATAALMKNSSFSVQIPAQGATLNLFSVEVGQAHLLIPTT